MEQEQDMIIWQVKGYEIAKIVITGIGKPLKGKKFFEVEIVEVLPDIDNVEMNLSVGWTGEVEENYLKVYKNKKI